MRFVVHVAIGDCPVARASIDEREGESPAIAGERLRQAVVRDANRHRHPGMDDATLVAIADEVQKCVREGLRDRRGQRWTVLSKDGRADRRPGEYATLTQATSPVALVEAIDDAGIAATEELLAGIFGTASPSGRADA